MKASLVLSATRRLATRASARGLATTHYKKIDRATDERCGRSRHGALRGRSRTCSSLAVDQLACKLRLSRL